MHRHEPSGTLHGLLRVRHITQDDAHIFCTEEQIAGGGRPAACDFGFCALRAVRLRAAPRALDAPEKRIGSDEMWDRAEAALAGALDAAGLAVRAQRGRRRLLRPEDRPAHDRLARPLLAARHGPARLLDARALRARLHRRRQRRAPAGDDPPRAARLVRALHRDPDRALRRRAPGRGSRRCRRSCCRSPTASRLRGARCASALRDAGCARRARRAQRVGRRARSATPSCARSRTCSSSATARPSEDGRSSRARRDHGAATLGERWHASTDRSSQRLLQRRAT